MRKLALLFTMMICGIYSNAQEVQVSGILKAFGQFPVKNIQVKAQKSKNSAISDSTGFFSILCKSEDVLIINTRPFKPAMIRINRPDSLNINLVLLDGARNQKMAYEKGFLREDEVAFGVQNLSDRNDDFYSYNNIYDIITGRFANVEVRNGRIYIRGPVQSISTDDSALILVNGIETFDISGIQPIEVASVEILRGTEAAFYGARGGNGVVRITLKSR